MSASVLPELGFYTLAGAPSSPRELLDEVREGESMGFGTVFISERFNIKEAVTLSGAAAAVSERIHIATAATNHNTRHPLVTASYATTMHRLTGGRFTLGLGRGIAPLFAAYGIPSITTAQLEDFAGLMRRLWKGEVIFGHDGPVGKYPVRTIKVMADICRKAEMSPGYPASAAVGHVEGDMPFPRAIAHAVADTAGSLGLETVVAFTESGNTARLVSRYRPNSRIVAFTPSPETCNRLAIVWGVTPLMFPRLASTDEMIAAAERLLLERGLVAAGDSVAMAAGIPPNEKASTNLLKLHVIGSDSKGIPGAAPLEGTAGRRHG